MIKAPPHGAECVLTHAEAQGELVSIRLAWPSIAQLAEHLTVERCSDQSVPGSIPGGRIATNKLAATTTFAATNKLAKQSRRPLTLPTHTHKQKGRVEHHVDND